MHILSTDLRYLLLLIQRILDADTLCYAQGAALLTEVEAAQRSFEAGDSETARRHVEQVVRFTEALAGDHELPPADGHAVLETAYRLLACDTG